MGREEACIRFATAPTRRLPGIGPKTAERLAELGYATVAQLQEADEAQLAARFGDRTARYLKARATFHDDSPVETEGGAAKSVSTERTFDEDIASTRSWRRSCGRSPRSSARACGARRAQGRTVAIKVRLADWTTVTRARTLPDVDQRHRAGHRDGDGAAARLRAAAAGAPARRPPRGVRRPRAATTGAGRAGGASRRSSRCAALVQRGGELAPRVARQRMREAELVEHADDDLAQLVLALARPRSAAIASISASRPASVSPASSAANASASSGSSTGGCGSPGRRRRTSSARWPAAPARPRGRRRRPASAPAGSPRRRGRARAPARGAGWRRRPRRPARRPRRGRCRSRKRSTCAGGRAPMNSSTTLPSLNAFTAGIDWIPKACDKPRVGVGVDLDELDLAVALGHGLLDHGPERAARAAPLGPEVDDHGLLEGALDDVALEGVFSGVDGHGCEDRRPWISGSTRTA